MYRTAIDKLNNSKAIDALLNEKVVNLDLLYDLKLMKPCSMKVEGGTFDVDISLNAQVPVRSVIKKYEDNLFYFEHFILDKKGSEIFVYEDEADAATIEKLSKIYFNLEESRAFNLNCVSQVFNHDIDLIFSKQVFKNSERTIIGQDVILSEFMENFKKVSDQYIDLKYPDGCSKNEYKQSIEDLLRNSTGIHTANLSFFSEKLNIDSRDIETIFYRGREFKEPENVEAHIENARDILNNMSQKNGNSYRIDKTLESNEFKALVALSIFEKFSFKCKVIEPFDELFDQQKEIVCDKGQAFFQNRTYDLRHEETKSMFSIRAKPNAGKVLLDTKDSTERFLLLTDGELTPNKNFVENILQQAKEFKQDYNTNDPAEFIAFIKNTYTGRPEVPKTMFTYSIEDKVAEIYKKNRALENSF